MAIRNIATDLSICFHMTKVISFNTWGYDEFIDFIKAYAIVMVLIAHTVPILDEIGFAIWGDMQVPLFILVQVFHCYKKEKAAFNFLHVMQRVMIPFFAVELFFFFIVYLTNWGGHDCKYNIINGLIRGGYGPGAYYPWVYLQLAFLLPLFVPLLKKKKTVSFITFLAICEGFEMFFSLVDLPDWIYRLLVVRYIFLIFLGWFWVKDGVVINRTTIIISLISLCSIVYFEYFSIDDEPLFFNTGWKFQRWPCYFYVAYGLTAMLRLLFDVLNQKPLVTRCYKQLALCSYEIFLVQMIVVYLLKSEHLILVMNIDNILFVYVIWLIIVWTTSVGGGILLNIFFKRIRHTNERNLKILKKSN